MRALIGCEFSDAVRSEFEAIGFEAWSCDLLPSENPDNKFHIQGDLLEQLDKGWDIMIAHPPCTHLSVSGAKWFKDKLYEQPLAIQFFYRLWSAPHIPRIALENPVSVASTYVGKPTQTIQPYEYGVGETKRTCLWLKNLPKLIPTCPVKGRHARVHLMTPSADRGKERSRLSKGIAQAMAKQWGLPMLAGTI